MSPVGVTVAVVGAPAPLESLADELRREVVDVAVMPIGALLDGPAAERAVVLLWFDTAIDPSLCARAVAWADSRRPRVGLIAWAPQGADGADGAETALAAGFDDAIVGHRSSREIAARVRAVHRRVHWRRLTSHHARIRVHGLLLDNDAHTLWFEGRSIALTATETAVLRALMQAGGKTLSRTDLLDAAWGPANFDISERAVDNVILRLRRKVGADDIIRTVRGVGFRLGVEP